MDTQPPGCWFSSIRTLYATDAVITLERVAVQKNTEGTDGTGLFFAAAADAHLENVLVAGSNDAVHRSVVVKANASMSATMSTFADVGTTVRYDAGASGTLYGNIIWPHTGIGNGLMLGAGASVTGQCNVGMVSPLGVGNLVVNPQFIPPTPRGKYRIDSASPAYNICKQGPEDDLDLVYVRPDNTYFEAGAFEVL